MVNRAIILAHRLVFEHGSELSPSSIGLIRRTLTSLAQMGVERVCIVDGEQADQLCERLALHEFPTLDVEVLANRSWRKASGSALLVARDFLESEPGPCLVLRGDRPLHGEALAELSGMSLGSHAVAIVVATPPESDLSDEVKVRLRSGEVTEVAGLGLDMERYDAVFTGHALVTPGIIEALEGMSNPELHDGLVELIAKNQVRALSGRIAWPWGIAQPSVAAEGVEAILDSKNHPHYTLLNPGPVNTTPRVKAAMIHHDVCHRDSSFSELLLSLTGKLRRIFRGTPQHETMVLTGSGTAAMECAISSVVPRDGKILVIDNGAFGERLLEICNLHEMDVVHLRYAWGDAVDPADVERMFDRHPDIAVVAMIHHETSVGLLNPVTEVGAIVRRFDALLIVDAVSSLGAEDLDVVRDNIDVCYGSANKCLHAISGAGFLCVSPRTWAKLEHIKPRSYYLDLKRYRNYVQRHAQTPFTPAVSAYFALDAACAEFLADGHAERVAMYRRRNARMRRGLAAMGMFPFTRSGRESHSVTTCSVPDGVTFQELYDELKLRGFIVYGCKDVLAEKFLQVANMGDLREVEIERFLETTRQVISELRGRKAAAASAEASASVEMPARQAKRASA